MCGLYGEVGGGCWWLRRRREVKGLKGLRYRTEIERSSIKKNKECNNIQSRDLVYTFTAIEGVAEKKHERGFFFF